MLTYVAITLFGWACLVLLLQRRVIYPRHLLTQDRMDGLDRAGTRSVGIDTPQGRVECWLAMGRGVSPDRPGPAVIFAHGNAELAGEWRDLLDAYTQIGVTIMMPEYRGYGRSEGSPTQAHITDDFTRFYDTLAREPGVDPTRIIFHGRSLGTGVLCSLASQRPPAAMILQSAFTSVAAIARGMLIPRMLVLDPYDNLLAVTDMDCPILIIHGSRDGIVPYRHGQLLHESAKRSRLITYDCGHNDCPPDWDVYWRDVTGFLKSNGLLTGPR